MFASVTQTASLQYKSFRSSTRWVGDAATGPVEAAGRGGQLRAGDVGLGSSKAARGMGSAHLA